MRDTPRSGTLGDFRKRYEGTYAFYNGKVVYLDSINNTRVSFKDKDDFVYSAQVDTGVMFDFLQVGKGWFNTPNQTYFLARVPQRQWQRGISDANTIIQYANSSGLTKRVVNIQELAAVFETPILTSDAVNEYLAGRRKSVALSKHFSIGKGGYVWLYNKVIGYYEDPLKIILHGPTFQQEVSDCIKRLQVPITVQVEVTIKRGENA